MLVAYGGMCDLQDNLTIGPRYGFTDYYCWFVMYSNTTDHTPASLRPLVVPLLLAKAHLTMPQMYYAAEAT